MKKNKQPPYTYEVAFTEGYLLGVQSAGWTCGGCGNTYEAAVTECPNSGLDQAAADLRRAKWKADNA